MNNDWYGRINLDGSFTPSRSAPKDIENHLLAFATNPAKVAAEHGKRVGSCSFCNRALTDKRSTELGYGPICAEKWNLEY